MFDRFYKSQVWHLFNDHNSINGPKGTLGDGFLRFQLIEHLLLSNLLTFGRESINGKDCSMRDYFGLCLDLGEKIFTIK